MSWWETGIEESQTMIISYDNLISQLLLNGGIVPYQEKTQVCWEATKIIWKPLSMAKDYPPIPHGHVLGRMFGIPTT
jgi:hypothetical protein